MPKGKRKQRDGDDEDELMNERYAKTDEAAEVPPGEESDPEGDSEGDGDWVLEGEEEFDRNVDEWIKQRMLA